MRRASPRSRRACGFTLTELMVILAVLVILAALSLNISSRPDGSAGRWRALTELQAFQVAIESYRLDHNTLPFLADASALPTAKGVVVADPADPRYKTASQLLFLRLTGRAGFKAVPPDNSTNYLPIKRGSVGNPDCASATPASADASYLIDPWGNPWGYYFNPKWATLNEADDATRNRGAFDLWSTAKRTHASPADQQQWIANWKTE